MVDMGEIEFNLTPVKEKQSRKYLKGSKYDPILDKFLEVDDPLMTVEVPDKDPNYLRTQLNKRIESRELSVGVSVVNGIVYLENK
jgi:hypothetical protein